MEEEETTREKELEAFLREILNEMDEIGFCCGYNDVVENIREKIAKKLGI